jgi:predicted ATPase/DNA-binding CsgD family transcriptional regulator
MAKRAVGNVAAPAVRRFPVPPTRFFGRQADIADLERLVARSPLLTLVGPPGGGKTRLAVEVARRLAARMADGVLIAELASASDPASVTDALCAAFGLAERPLPRALDSLGDAVADKNALVILDNCEHVAAPAAEAARRLVESSAGLRVLATSRVPLALPGEQIFRVAPLDPQTAGELFVDRARLAVAEFPVDPATEVEIARICSRLDRQPLAIELAAGWTRVLSPAEVAGRLDDALALLKTEARNVTPRQATMEATIDWSYRLLDTSSQRLFERLSVFAGGFDLDAAEAVADADGAEVLEGLTALVDHSLVLTEPMPSQTMRYHLHEPLRQFGAARSRERGESDAVRLRHAEHYLEVALDCDRRLRRRGRSAVLRRLERDDANFHDALEWARTLRSDLFARLCVALSRSWELRGRITAGRAWLESASTLDAIDARLRATVLARAGRLAWRQSNHERAGALLEASLAIERNVGDESSVARRLRSLSLVSLSAGDARRARPLAEQCVSVLRAEDDERGLAWALVFLAWAHLADGDLSAGRQRMCEALHIGRTAWIEEVTLNALLGLAYESAMRGDAEAQRTSLTEALVPLESVGGDLEQVVWLWLGAVLASSEHRYASALRVAGKALAHGRRHGGESDERLVASLEPMLEPARRAFGQATVGRLSEHGAGLEYEESISEALSESASSTDDPLSPREREVVELVAEGLSNPEIAARLFISRRTVESHVDHIKQKLRRDSRNEVMAWALRERLDASPAA